MLRAAIAARPMTALANRTWRVLIGVNVPEPDFESLTALASGNVVVERARGDFPTLAANCALSISQGGYNTMMELLEGGARCVIVPYAGGIETEQTLRAREIAKRTPVQVLDETNLSPDALARAADAADTEEYAVDAAPAVGWRAVLASFLILFAAEWGDLSQLLTVSLVARYEAPLSVFAGALGALLTVSALAVIVGRSLLRRVALHVLHFVGAGVCVLLATLTLVELAR